MRGTIRVTLMALTALACAGCTTMKHAFNHQAGYSTEFIAGNASGVLIDYAHGSDPELDAAHTLAENRCALFGKTTAVLDSVNPRGDDTDRASYICQ